MTDKELFDLLIESSSLRPDLLERAKKLWGGVAIKMEICDCKITLKQFLELPMGIHGKISIWPPAMPGENLGQLYERIENFDSINDKGLEKYEDCIVMQIFASASTDLKGELNIVLR